MFVFSILLSQVYMLPPPPPPPPHPHTHTHTHTSDIKYHMTIDQQFNLKKKKRNSDCQTLCKGYQLQPDHFYKLGREMIVEGKYVHYSNSDPGTRQHYIIPFY